MLFSCRGIDARGKKVKLKIEASNITEVKQKLKFKKVIYTKIEEDSFASFRKISFRPKYKLPAIALSTLSRDLSIYLKSGISLLNAIKLIAVQYKNDKHLSSFFETITTYLDEGKTFYNALDMQTSITLPEYYKQAIKISEDGGLLDSVLLEMSIYLKEQDRLKKQISSAMAYPIFIFTISVMMVGFMLSFIVPKITAIFEQYDQELPTSTQIVITLGDFFSKNYDVVLAVIISVIVIFLVMMKKSYKFKYAIDVFMLKIPFISRLIELGELSRFAYINSVLIRSGVPAVQSFKMGANILQNSVFKNLFTQAANKVVEGEKLSVLLENSKIYKVDTAFIQAVAIGEETSELSNMLQNLAQMYSEANKDKISIFLSLLEPMFMLFVGSTIGFIVVAMLLPIFSINFG